MMGKTTMDAIVFAIITVLAVTACASGGEDGGKNNSAGTFIEADNPLIRYSGRIDFSDPKAPSFAFPGIRVRAQFSGNTIGVRMSDLQVRDFFAVFIDGTEYPAIRLSQSVRDIVIAENLADGNHVIDLYKRTEGLCGTAVFSGFLLAEGETLLEAPDLPDRKIEFIGDSITCGYGNLVSTLEPEKFPFTPQNEDNTQAWGALSAKDLDMQYMATAYSGRGMYVNLDGSSKGTMPELYDSIFPDHPDKASWDHTLWTPDIIVINLGTNDYNWAGTKADLSRDDFDAAFTKTYKTFIDRLIKIHGTETEIICAIGPLMNDSYPAGSRSLTRIRKALSGLVKEYNEAGTLKLHFLELKPQHAPYGEDWHPTAATHRRMADTLVQYIRENLDAN